MGYALLVFGGIMGIGNFPAIWNNMESNGGQGFNALIPDNLDPLIGTCIALGMVTMMLGILWAIHFINSFPRKITTILKKKYPNNVTVKIALLPLDFLGVGIVLYWAYWVGIIDRDNGQNLLYLVVIALAVILFTKFTPVGKHLTDKVQSWKWIARLQDKDTVREIKTLQTEVLRLETDLQTTRAELQTLVIKKEKKEERR
jgi:hypothetical protein